jgi:hypothetical protein
VFANTDLSTLNTTPTYPDRNYGILPLRQPRGATPNGDAYNRWFLLRCPDISAIDSTVEAVYDLSLSGACASAVIQSRVATLTGLIGISPLSAGQTLTITNAATGMLNNPLIVVSVTGPASCTVAAPFYSSSAPLVDANNGAIHWSITYPAPAGGAGLFVTAGDGLVSGVPFGFFAFDYTSLASGIYDAICSSVNNLVGEGVRWTLLVDPQLQS